MIYDNDQVFLYRLVPERLVERLHVVPVLANKEFVEPAGGVAEGDTVIIAGQAALKDGAKVRLVSEMEAAEAGATNEPESSEASTSDGGQEDDTRSSDS